MIQTLTRPTKTGLSEPELQMAKLAAFPKCYIEDIVKGRMTLYEWIEMASSLPVDGIELYDKFLRSYDSGYLSELRKEVNRRNLETPMMCYSPDFTDSDKAGREREIVEQQEIIRVTAELGGKYCRILSGQKRPGVSLEEGIKWVVEAIQRSLETAKNNNIVLVMENHYKDGSWKYPEFAQKSEIFLAIINQIDSPFFGVQYDPSNATMAGEDPLEVLAAVKHRVKTMHASDRYLIAGSTLDELRQSDGTIGYSSKLCHGVIGQGLNNYNEIFRVLKEINFDGWISIEDGMSGIGEIEESAFFLRQKMSEFGLVS